MTSEYDELLARLDALAEHYRLANDHARNMHWRSSSGHYEHVLTDIKDSQDAIRALTAQVVERDAVIEHALAISNGQGNNSVFMSVGGRRKMLNTLSRAPRDSLATRDAVRDKTVRATALRDAAEELGGMLADQKTLRDRADQEEQ